MNIIYELSKNVSPQEVIELRSAGNWNSGNTEELWHEAIEQALCVATARDGDAENKLVGIGFVVGNNRHAQMVDLVVRPDYRQHGIGGKLFDMRVQFCRDKKITYVGLTFDPKTPWLKDFYERHGFVQIDFAMWLKESVEKVK